MKGVIKYLKKNALLFDIDHILLLAITQVEARSKGFVAPNKPIVLFERHVFYKRLEKRGFNIDKLANQYPLLVNKNPGGYLVGPCENYRLKMAKQINENCAIESASFGLFQTMGFHWQVLGYQSALDFEKQMSESELKQTEAFIRFISLKSNSKMIVALKEHDYAAFARLYNGQNYKKNHYDYKIKAAYESLKAINQ